MYIYLLDKNKKEVIEMNPHPDILCTLKSLKITYYDFFPYERAGYEDPYSFMDNYKLIKLKETNGQLIFEEADNNV